MAKKIISLSREEQWEIVKPYINDGLSYREIAKELDISKRTICRIKDWARVNETTDFPHDGENYIIQDGKYKPKISLIDEIFGMYSRSGLDWSSAQIINELGLTGTEWYMIHRHFGLNKQCDILSPSTWNNHSGDEKETIDAVLDNLNKKYRSKIIRTRQLSYVKRSYEKEISKQNAAADVIRDIHANLAELFNDLPPQKLEITKAKTKGEHIVVSIADIHLGANTTGLLATKDYSTDIIESRLNELSERVNALEAAKIELIIAGDLIESFMGNNHPNSWMGLEPGMYGAKAVFETRRVLSEFIAKVQNVENVHCVTGNHDRATGSNKIDVKGEIGLIIYELLNATFPKLNFNIDDHVVKFMTGGVAHIVFHGHTGSSHKAKKKNSVDAKFEALKYAREFPNQFMILYTAHYHEFRIFHEDTNYVSLCLPSIFSGNSYSERLGFTSLPGALVTKIHNGLPSFERITLA